MSSASGVSRPRRIADADHRGVGQGRPVPVDGVGVGRLSGEVRQLLAAAGASAAADGAAVRAVLRDLAASAPGRSVELRVPPFGAVQLVEGPRHRRGTPKATVEMSADVLLALVRGERDWERAVGAGEVFASGERCDLSFLFPAIGGSASE